MPDKNGILIIGEMADGDISTTTKELLTTAHKLATDLGGAEVATTILGKELGNAPQEAIAFGADKVYSSEHPLLTETQPDAHLAVLTQIAMENSPKIILSAKSFRSQEIATRLAFRLGTGLAQDCLEVSIDSETSKLQCTRPVYGGNAIAHVLCNGTPMMATIRPRTCEPMERDSAHQGELVVLEPGIDDSVIKARFVERVEKEVTGVRLEDAKTIVAGGRGLGGAEPFAHLDELAKLLGAAVGASRAACDAGWVPPGYQIGLTGKSVSPNLYITVAISGASQHLAGCSGAQTIIAINKDGEANIFKESRYGVIGDWKKVLPAFIEQVRELVN